MYKEILKYRKLEFFLYMMNKAGFPITKWKSLKVENKYCAPKAALSYLYNLKKDPKNSAITDPRIESNIYDLQIVVPVYNSAATIKSCIESILHQNTDFSVLVNIIDDGSTDNSAKIIKEILNEKKYNAKIEARYIYQKNEGFSGARNRGLEIVEGKYIMFVDSDDIILPDSINKLLNCAIRSDSDIVEGGFDYFNSRRTWKGVHHVNQYDIDNIDLITGMPWGKVYKSKLWGNIKFPENYLFEDTIIKYLIAMKATKISTISDIVYKYRKSNQSISFTSKNNIASLDTFYITRQCLEDCKKINISYNEKLYNLTLEQIIVNDKRLRNFPKKVRLAVFAASCDLIAKCFGDIRTSKDFLKDIEKGIKQRNYSYFFVSIIELKL